MSMKSMCMPERIRDKQRKSMENFIAERSASKLSFELQSSKVNLRPFNHSFGTHLSQILL